MKFNIVKLEVKSPVHFGIKPGASETTEKFPRSDTIYSAIINNSVKLYGKEIADKIKDKIKVSSGFPYIARGNKEIYYFPIPLNQFSENKEIKKRTYISKDIFEKIIAGEKEIDDFKELLNEPERFVKIADNPHSSVSRNCNGVLEYFYFYSTEIFYNREKVDGYYFIYEIDDSIDKIFRNTLELVKDTGIGGLRTYGKGLIEKLEYGDISIKTPEKSNYYVSLSFYYQSGKDKIDYTKSYYKIIRRGGYIYSYNAKPYLKKEINLLAEGSVLFSQSEKPEGILVDVTPDIFREHKVYKNGYFIGIPVKGDDNNVSE